MKLEVPSAFSRLLLVVYVLSSYPRRSRTQCTEPYVLHMGYCLYISNFTTTWCSAAAHCQSMGGELVMELGAIRSLIGLANYIYIGVTDLLVERQTNRSNWRFTNGSLFPELSSPADWRSGRPNSLSADDDSVVVGVAGMTDGGLTVDSFFVCQPMATPGSPWLRRQDFLKLGNISPTYCHTEATVASQPICHWLCTQRWQCRAVLFNANTRACRMLDYADASVGDGIENDPAWDKYIKEYQ